MKLIVSQELKSRLGNAALNGSIIAKDILAEIHRKSDASEIVRGTINYFGTKRKKTAADGHTKIKVVFTACSKDLSHENFPDKGNPQAPWFKENRTDMEPATFVKCFTSLPDYSDQDMEYFANCICVDSRVTVKLYSTMQDFIEAYSEENYSTIAQAGDSTLHNSCMRHEETARNAADFYFSFARAQILIATDAARNILGRAVVWPNARTNSTDTPVTVSVVDRVYYTHSFVHKMILRHAEEIGIALRKRHNDYSHCTDFVVMNPVEGLDADRGDTLALHLSIKVPASKWHKRGVPYLDTFLSIRVARTEDDKLQLELTNWRDSSRIANCQSTSGYAIRERVVCPACGKLHDNPDRGLCAGCYDKMTEQTLLGRIIVGKSVKYQGRTYPADLIHKGKPIPTPVLYQQTAKLFGEN